jgi:uncharacterized protein YcbK (DUF882 family)
MTLISRRAAWSGATALLLSGATATERALAIEAAKAAELTVGRDRLWMKRINGTEIEARFRDGEGFDSAQILMLSWFMRDVNDRNKAVWIEPRLFDLLAAVQTSMSSIHGAPIPLMLTSGYRTPEHNSKIETAARNSMHLYGYAADLYAPGYSPRAVALAASFFKEGGIGLYDSFTHLDVWKLRVWAGRKSA